MKNITQTLLVFITVALCVACSENPAATGSTGDSASVKILNADSNSEMPVHTPKDSTSKMPNAHDSKKEPSSR